MYADSVFRICLIVSISLHLCLVLPWPFFNLLSKPEIRFQKIEAIYFNEDRIPRTVPKDIAPQNVPKPPIYSAIKSGSNLAINATDGNNPSEMVSAKKDEQGSIKEADIKKEENKKSSIEQIEEKRDEVEIIDIGTQKGAVYEKYYFDVREKIRSIIEENKKGLLKESEVCIRFMLDRNGTLKDLYLYKSSGADADSLERLAVKSIKEAVPFPPFSDKIKESELQFNLPIRVIRKH